jgi:predicted amidohydrolase
MAASLPLSLEAAPLSKAETYAAVALQFAARSIERTPDKAAARKQMAETIASLGPKIRAALVFIRQYGGAPVRLAVLPEYFLTSYPGRISIPEFADKAALEIDGPEYEALGKIAQEQKLFLAGNAYETDRHFPGLYFQTSFVIAPDGKVVLRYRRLNSMFAPTPHDVWSKYLDIYGLDGVFPVARTEIGNLAAIASEEILYPEIARAHALRGAEIFVHSSSEIGSPMATPKMIAKRARAFENLTYVISANTAGIVNTDIDLAALRAARRKPGMTNTLSRQRNALFAAAYAADTHQRADSLIDGGVVKTPDRDHFLRVSEETIERLAKDGLI